MEYIEINYDLVPDLAMINKLEEGLKQQGIKKVILLTSRGNLTKDFYENHGYKVCEDMIMLGRNLE